MIRLSGLCCALAAILVLSPCGATPHLLGQQECTFGPTYWCENIPQAKQCNAFAHCRQTVWEKHVYPKDNDEICKICLDMVTQARDQLRNNETLEELQEVFEGSCALIPVKLIRKECDKLVDDFVPELVETLSSEMDPTAVCSVAGLCNNKKIDKLLAEEKQKNVFTCDKCQVLGKSMEEGFKKANADDVLDALTRGCGYMGSFSDSCHSLALIHFQDIYAALKQRLTQANVCLLSGACSLKYHQHPEEEQEEDSSSLEIRPMGNVGILKPQDEKDIPCDLCKQLVVHLREIIIANTTEAEFKTVLHGICDVMLVVKDECNNIVDNYADVVFNMISTGLNPEIVCEVIKICTNVKQDQRLVMPLLLLEPAKIEMSLKKKEKNNKLDVDAFQLPFDTLMGPQNADQLVQNGEVCTLCEMVLHFLQQTLAQVDTEEQIKEKVEGVCEKLPQSIRAECKNFVTSYGDAVIAMLIQEMDPSEVCPLMKMCSQKVKEDVELFEPMHVSIESKDKPTCPLCLFAVTEAKNRIQSDKSIANIKHTLETLCTHLPQKLNVECTDFVDSYAQMLVNLLAQEMSPQDICVELKLCTATRDKAVPSFAWSIEENEMDNEIPDNTFNGRVIVKGHATPKSTPECLVCQQVVKELEKKLDDKHSRESIKKILDHVCDKVKPSMKDKCVAFIDKHEEQIIDLVMKGAQPKELCIALGFCMISGRDREVLEDIIEGMTDPFADDLDIDEAISIDFISIPAGPSSVGRIQLTNNQLEEQRTPPKANEGCILCEFVMTKLEADLNNKATQDQIRKAVENVCQSMPKSVRAPCTKFVDNYSEMIITILATTPPAKVCQELKMCTPPKMDTEQMMKEVNNDVLECAVCQGAVTIVDRLLEDPNFDRDLEQVVEKTCSIAPRLYKSKCSELVRAYGPSMINLLLAKAQPEKVCEEIQLCFPNEYSTFVQINDEVIPSRIRRRRSAVLGAKKCTWGPTYWCSNLQAAEECNAVNHCLEKHWNGVKPSA